MAHKLALESRHHKSFPHLGSNSAAQTARNFFKTQANLSSYAVFLGGADEASSLNRQVLIGLNPRRILSVQQNQLTLDGQTHAIRTSAEIFKALRNFAAESSTTLAQRPCMEAQNFYAGIFVHLNYEAARWFEPAMATHNTNSKDNLPDILAIDFEDWLVVDGNAQNVSISSSSQARVSQYQALWQEVSQEAIQNREKQTLKSTTSSEINAQPWQSSLDEGEFSKAVEKIKQHIAAGDVYQVNLSRAISRSQPVKPSALFEALCTQNPSPFAGVLKTPQAILVSNSPERLVRVDASGLVEARPIAGTRGRGQTHAEDHDVGERLRANPKEQAEHMMLVDLERNDLGRVCKTGSIEVSELLTLERYSHVTHLVSNVQGHILENKDWLDVLQATFPGGTITGCPKIRCMEILHRQEPFARGFYTGSFGIVDGKTGAADFNILIRSVLLTNPVLEENIASQVAALAPDAHLAYDALQPMQVRLHVGAGIVADSVAAHEFRECGRKAQALISALDTIITSNVP